VEDLIAEKGIKFTFRMYETVVEKWCARESGFVPPDKLRDFSECLAEEMFLSRGERRMERKLRGRSLLNRDAAGHYKFSHRSILEYLFVKRFTRGLVRPHSEPWTDLTQSFLREMLRSPEAAFVPWAHMRVDSGPGESPGRLLDGPDARHRCSPAPPYGGEQARYSRGTRRNCLARKKLL
jgi:hypothetical protein